MDELFGLSMTVIMFVLLAIFAVCVLTVAYVLFRNRLIFMLGLRNIPRRKAQSILVVVGLMLSSLIITASLATGDTIDRSITAAVYENLGTVDEVISVDIDDEAATRDELYFSRTSFDDLADEVEGNPAIDAMSPALFETVNAFSPDSNLSEPTTTLAGHSPDLIADFGPLNTVTGDQVHIADLEDGQAFINEELAENLDVQQGDTVVVFAHGRETEFEIAAVVENTRIGGDLEGGGGEGLTSSRNGIVVPLTIAQEIVERPGQISAILISNQGDARSGVDLTDEVIAAVSPIFESDEDQTSSEIAPRIEATKRDGLEEAEEVGNIFSTIFVIFGLFSIAAGILLIFLIFVMLAAERRPEMGMARAVGMKRSHLIQQFITEGMAYDVGAAFVGTIFGIGVAFLLVTVMVNIFGVDIPLEYYISPRSLVIALCLAMSLTFLTIFFSSLNISRLNIVAAIADLPQPTVRRTRARGELLLTLVAGFYALLVFALGFAVGVVLLGEIPLLSYLLGMACGSALVTLLGRVPGPIGRLHRTIIGALSGLSWSALGIFFGALLMLLGQTGDILALFTMGFSLVVLGVIFFLTYLTRISGRILWTIGSVVLLVFWLLPQDAQRTLFGEMNADFEMFFVSGIFIVVASTIFLVYNADLMLWVFKVIGARFSALMPSFRMAVVYPLASRLRTGLTMAMFSLIMFALVMMAILNGSFLKAQASDEALGGWDVLVTTSPNTEITDLRSAIEDEGDQTTDIDAVGRVSLASLFGANAIQTSTPADPEDADEIEQGVVTLWGGDQEFLDNNSMPLQTIAEGYDDQDAVWEALAADPNLAVVDASAVTGFDDEGGDAPFRLHGVESGDDTMEPIEVRVENPLGNEDLTVTVVGVIDETVILAQGLFTSQEAIEPLYGDGDLNQFFVRTVPGANADDVAKDIESTLFTQGVQSESLDEILGDIQAQQEGFLYLLEGFMSLGLIVGVAALGVISLRAVVERRQQIGMLRAIGFRGSMVSLAFMLESGFVAFVGLWAGILCAFVLSYNLLNSSEISGSSQIEYYIPWGQILLFAGLAFLASLIMTWFPARAASNVPVAEALRYE